MLTQRDKSGNERVISYASRALSEREKAFSATEKEALAVVFALEQFRVYLLGVHFLLVTDLYGYRSQCFAMASFHRA